MLSGEAVVECRSDVEAGTISGMRSLNSLFYVRAWLRINSDGTTTRIDAQLSQLIPSGRTPAEFRSHFTKHSESTLKLGIWGSYTLIWQASEILQMTRDAMAARQGQTSFSSLYELWGAIDNTAWHENPTMRYLENMKSRSMRAVMLASTASGRPGDEGLRQQCAKLIEELPQSSIEKHQIVESTPLEALWKAVSKLVTQAIGEVVLLQPEEATWTLTEVHNAASLAENYLERQFLIVDSGKPRDFASSWLGKKAERKNPWC